MITQKVIHLHVQLYMGSGYKGFGNKFTFGLYVTFMIYQSHYTFRLFFKFKKWNSLR